MGVSQSPTVLTASIQRQLTTVCALLQGGSSIRGDGVDHYVYCQDLTSSRRSTVTRDSIHVRRVIQFRGRHRLNRALLEISPSAELTEVARETIEREDQCVIVD